MSARKAVLLTVLIVALLAAMIIGGYFGVERYQRLVTRADTAETRAEVAEQRLREQQVPQDRLRAEYERGFTAGKKAGANDIIGFIRKPGFYIAEVAEDAKYPFSIVEAVEMIACRQYHVDTAGNIAYIEEEAC